MDMFTVNDRNYHLPEQPVVVICVDGCEEAYLDVALAQDRMPSLARILEMGWRGSARGALPSFTNVNNAAIVTGMPPSVTGLSGNFFLNPDTGEEVMMNSAAFLRCETILAAAAQAGRKVAMVTAKEKLRDLLSPGLRLFLSPQKKPRLRLSGLPNYSMRRGCLRRCSVPLWARWMKW